MCTHTHTHTHTGSNNNHEYIMINEAKRLGDEDDSNILSTTQENKFPMYNIFWLQSIEV